jgi:hypothetical protein
VRKQDQIPHQRRIGIGVLLYSPELRADYRPFELPGFRAHPKTC